MKQRMIVASLALAVMVAVGGAQVSNEALRRWVAERNKTASSAPSASQPASTSAPAEPVDCTKIKAILEAAQDQAIKSPARKAEIYEEASAAVKPLLSGRRVEASFLIYGVNRDKGVATLFVRGPLPPDDAKKSVVWLAAPIIMELQEPAEQAGLIKRNTNLIVRGKAVLIANDDKDHLVKLEANATIPVAREQADGTFAIQRLPVVGNRQAWQCLPNEQWLFRVEGFHLVLLKDQCSYQVDEATFKPAQSSNQVIKQ